MTPKEEEDFTIKPHLMFSQDEHHPSDEKNYGGTEDASGHGN